MTSENQPRSGRATGLRRSLLLLLVPAAVAAVIAVRAADRDTEPEPTGAVTAPSAPADPATLPSRLPTGPLGTSAATRADTASCPDPTVTVSSSDALANALATATPGTSIRMADGVYDGNFKIITKGTEAQPVALCGGSGAVLDAGGFKEGYGLHLDGASWWRLSGFTVRNAQKGVMADGANHVVISGLTVEQIGDEAIHLRKFSSDNVVENNTVRQTGKRKPKFGEGIYIGTAVSNWGGITAGAPDTSDRNVIRGNRISATTAESVDVKEGTTGGTVVGNTFDGSGLAGDADSWVDVKGNNWTISGNTGANSPEDGFQTHQVADGWGRANTFTGNTAEVNGPGFGFHLAPVENNRVACDNKVVGAAQGLANVNCTQGVTP